MENLPIDPAIENWIRARGGHCEEVSQEEGEVIVRPTVHLIMIVKIMVIMIIIMIMMMVSQEEGEVVVRPTVHLVMIMRIMNIESLELTASPFEKGHIPGLQSPR